MSDDQAERCAKAQAESAMAYSTWVEASTADTAAQNVVKQRKEELGVANGELTRCEAALAAASSEGEQIQARLARDRAQDNVNAAQAAVATAEESARRAAGVLTHAEQIKGHWEAQVKAFCH